MARRLQVLAPLATGGMGSVSLARRGGALLAIKRPHPHLVDDQRARLDFDREARYAAQLRHPNVVPVLEVGADDVGPYVLMEYVHGVALSELIRGLVGRRERLPLPTALAIAVQAAHGLGAVHTATNDDGVRLGLVHRDVSPQNFMVGFDGRVRLTDFGIAKALETTERSTTGLLKGKLGYLAPERLRFESFDQRADLFALGVVLYELFACRRLYASGRGSGEDQVAQRILEEPPPDLGEVRRDVPPELVELLFELLAKEPAERPADAADVAARLESMSASGDLEARVGAMLRETLPELVDAKDAALAAALARPRPRRRAGVAAAVLVAAAGIGATAALVGEPEPPPPEPEPVAAASPADEGAPPTTAEPTTEPEPVAIDLGSPDAGSVGRARARRRARRARRRAGEGVSLWELE